MFTNIAPATQKTKQLLNITNIVLQYIFKSAALFYFSKIDGMLCAAIVLMKTNFTTSRAVIVTALAAFTLVEIMIVVLILALILAIAVPNYVRQRACAQANTCINNLVKIESAAAQFALENGKKNGDLINYPDDIKPYIKLTSGGEIPTCPASGIYALTLVGTNPTCTLGTLVTPAHLLP
jgi:prepilin-type N-terminal cleavage/methylation domain-containing protein